VSGRARLVGREQELAIAREVLEGLDGGARALLIEGDAGIGKTAVWRAARELAGRALVCVAATLALGPAAPAGAASQSASATKPADCVDPDVPASAPGNCPF